MGIARGDEVAVEWTIQSMISDDVPECRDLNSVSSRRFRNPAGSTYHRSSSPRRTRRGDMTSGVRAQRKVQPLRFSRPSPEHTFPAACNLYKTTNNTNK